MQAFVLLIPKLPGFYNAAEVPAWDIYQFWGSAFSFGTFTGTSTNSLGFFLILASEES